jgi:hypothetical protein
MTNPKEHRSRLRSANPIERPNGEIKRRTEVEPPYSRDTVSQSAPTHLAMPGKICHPFHQL